MGARRTTAATQAPFPDSLVENQQRGKIALRRRKRPACPAGRRLHVEEWPESGIFGGACGAWL